MSANRSVLAFRAGCGGRWGAGRGWGGHSRHQGATLPSALPSSPAHPPPPPSTVSPAAASLHPPEAAGWVLAPPWCFAEFWLSLAPHTCQAGETELFIKRTPTLCCSPPPPPNHALRPRTNASSHTSPAETPSLFGGLGNQGAASFVCQRCQAIPAGRPGGVVRGVTHGDTGETGGRGQTPPAPPRSPPDLVTTGLQEEHLGFGEGGHGNGLDTVGGVQPPPAGGIWGVSAPPPPEEPPKMFFSPKELTSKRPHGYPREATCLGHAPSREAPPPQCVQPISNSRSPACLAALSGPGPAHSTLEQLTPPHGSGRAPLTAPRPPGPAPLFWSRPGVLAPPHSRHPRAPGPAQAFWPCPTRSSLGHLAPPSRPRPAHSAPEQPVQTRLPTVMST